MTGFDLLEANTGAADEGLPNDEPSAVFGASAAEWTLHFDDTNLEKVRAARNAVASYLRFVASEIPGGIAEETIENTKLCTDELAADAVENGGEVGLTHVRVLTGLGAIAVAVGSGKSKNDSVPHANHDVPLDAESGRGLEIVEILSEEWGFKTTDPAKTGDRTATETWFVMKNAAKTAA